MEQSVQELDNVGLGRRPEVELCGEDAAEAESEKAIDALRAQVLDASTLCSDWHPRIPVYLVYF